MTQTSSFVDRVDAVRQRIEYRRADTTGDMETIYRLRHDAYVREGALLPTSSGTLTDAYDDLENTWNFGLYLDGRLASSFRLHVNVPGHSTMPVADVFPDYIVPELAAGRTIVDPTRFVADFEVARTCPELPYLTVRLGFLAADYFSADIVTATVRSEHQAFYRRVFGHKVVSLPRQYLTLTKPLALMMLRYPPERERIIRRYPFFHSTEMERRQLFERPERRARRPAA